MLSATRNVSVPVTVAVASNKGGSASSASALIFITIVQPEIVATLASETVKSHRTSSFW
jgi:hypothetical protein